MEDNRKRCRDVEFIYLSISEAFNLTLKLYDQIKKSGFHPDLIVGIARGGWIPARLLSDFFQNIEITSIRIKFYRDIGERAAKPLITQPLTVDVRGKCLLVVDDVADTGHSLVAAKKHIENFHPKDLKIATLYVKPSTIIIPDYFVEKTDKWIIFPWEIKETILSLIKQNMSPSKIKEILESTGIKRDLIEYFIEETGLE